MSRRYRRYSRYRITGLILSAVTAVTAVLSLSGCSASVEELLSPPRLDGEQTEIYEALRAYTNSDIILKYPRSGQYRSAFVVKDLDEEPTDEAMVFYEMPNVTDGSSLRLNFLDKQNGKWVSVYDFAASGSEVESVMFEDLGDGSVTMIVTYLVQNSSDRYTSVMTYKDGSPEELANVRNIYLDIFDATGDGNSDIFTIISERTSGRTAAGIYGIAGGSLSRLAQVYLNSGFAGIRDVTPGLCDTKQTHSVFIDYALSDGYFGTDAVICANGHIYLSPVIGTNSILRISNTYTPYISCMDADGDGVFEIPSTEPFPGYGSLPRAEQVNMTIWHELQRSGTFLTRKYRSFVGTKNDYIFFFPEDWAASVTASVSISESMVRFNRYNIISDVTEEWMMSIYGASEGSTAKYESDDYVYLGTSESSGYSYYAELGRSSFTPEAEELKELFRLR